MNLHHLGRRIRERREKRGLRQADIAAALRISAQAVSKWERGENAPDISVLVDLCRLLGVSVEWLLGGAPAENDTFPAAVFCTSLNGFARRAAELAPRDVAAWANGLYYGVTEALLAVEGVPVKYVGDGFLGFLIGQDAVGRALRAAQAARTALNTPDLQIVIHHGPIYLGAIGHPDYANPDILGQTVNTAFLVMSYVATQTAGIGVTDDAREQLKTTEQAFLTPSGTVDVPGMDRALTVYEPTSEPTA